MYKLVKKYLSTAGLVCAMRGALAYDDSHPMNAIFRDKFAATLCGRPWNLAFICPPLSLSLFFLLFRKLVPGSSVLVVRAHYMESQLDKFVAEHGGGKGVQKDAQQQGAQYVMVAAGMDSFLLRKRQLAEELNVYEIDLPQPQQIKQARLKSMGCHIPSNYHFVTADLFSQSLIDALVDKGFDAARPAFYSVMGLIYYLPKASFIKMIDGMAKRGAEGSVIVLDYLLDNASLDEDQLRFKQNCSHEVAEVGEEFIYETSSEELVADMAELGFSKVSMLPIQELYSSSGLDNHPTAGPNCFALAMFVLTKKNNNKTKTT